MKIIFFGTPDFAVPSLQLLLSQPEIEVLAVVTQPDKPRGRGKQLIPSPVKQIAIEHNLPILQPKRLKKNQQTLNFLRQSQADFFVVVAYGQILSQEILDFPRLGCINGHGSILPKYRGAAPIQWSIYHGEKETGMTTMLMDAGMDTGPMLLKSYTTIGFLDNAQELGAKLAESGAKLLHETLLKMIQGELEPIPQNEAEATYAPLINKSDYLLNWDQEALALHHQIRAFYPDCFTHFRQQPLKIIATVPLGEPYWEQLPPEFSFLQQRWGEFSQLTGTPGEIISLVKKQGFIVQTGAGLLLVRAVQLPGKRIQSGWDFVNGARLQVGEKLGTVQN